MGSPQEVALDLKRIEVLYARKKAIQAPLGNLVQRASQVFDLAASWAPDPVDMPREYPVTLHRSEPLHPGETPKNQKLTVRLDDHKWFQITSHTGTGYRDMTVWYNWPYLFHMRRAEVHKLPEGIEDHLPFDINVAEWSANMDRYQRPVREVDLRPDYYIDKIQRNLDLAAVVIQQHRPD